MRFSKTQLKMMSDNELNAVAEALGLEISTKTDPKTKVLDAVYEAQPKEEAPSEAIALDKPEAEKKYTIVIHNQDGIDTSPFVKVQINGIMTTIPREIPVVVSQAILGVLNTAVMVMYDGNDESMAAREVRRFPYTVLGEA